VSLSFLSPRSRRPNLDCFRRFFALQPHLRPIHHTPATSSLSTQISVLTDNSSHIYSVSLNCMMNWTEGSPPGLPKIRHCRSSRLSFSLRWPQGFHSDPGTALAHIRSPKFLPFAPFCHQNLIDPHGFSFHVRLFRLASIFPNRVGLRGC
jgi:hypothetical protein